MYPFDDNETPDYLGSLYDPSFGGGYFDPSMLSGGGMDPNSSLAGLGNAMYYGYDSMNDMPSAGGGNVFGLGSYGSGGTDTGYDPGYDQVLYDPSDPGFVDPATGEWVANPSYDPTTVNNLPMSGGAATDPTLQSGSVFTNPTFSVTGASTMPGDANGPYIGEPPSSPNFQPTPMPDEVNGIQKPYPPPGTMTTGYNYGGQADPSASTGGFKTSRGNPSASNQQSNKKPPAAPASTPASSTQITSNSLAMPGLPPMPSSLPTDQKFTYTPVSIGRQGAPNVAPPQYGTTQQDAGQSNGFFGTLGRVGQAVGNRLGVPTTLAQLRQQLGLPQGQQSPYDSGL